MPQTVGAYLVAIITILTAADLVFPGLEVSEEMYRLLVLVLIALIPLVVALSWFYDITRHGIIPSVSREEYLKQAASQKRVAKRHSAPVDEEISLQPAPERNGIESVAILPFTNSSNDTDGEYLSDGITETIINKLAQLADVRVIPRATAFRYKHSDLLPVEICQELNVHTSVSGSISHVNDRLVVQAELVDSENESQIWGERYNAQWENLFDVQEEIATKISSSIKPELSREERRLLKHRETASLEAYKEYLQGRFLWNKRTPNGVIESIRYFRTALEKDPLYAVAYSGLADAYNILGYYSILSPAETYPLAKEADLKALEIEPDLSEAHASLGYANLFFDRDWEKAKDHFQRAIELNPGYGTAYQWYAWYLLVMGRFDEALASLETAIKLDPLSQIINDHLAYGYMLTGRFNKARKQIERTRALDPNYPLALWRLGDWQLGQGHLEKAADAYSQVELVREGRYTLGYLGLTYGLLGREDDAKEILRRMDEYEEERYVSPLDRAFVHSGLGNNDEAFSYIDIALEIRVSDMVRFKLLPWPEAIKSDPRFAVIIEKLGLPA